MNRPLLDHRFELLEQGGSGSFGTVWRALDTRTSTIVAVKVFHGSQPDHARFEREAAILSALRHPKVVAYVAHGHLTEGPPWLAMEWLDGEDLAAVLARGALAPEDALRLALQVAQGVAAAHALGILHRDLKPSNIFLVGGRTNDVRVIDFGIAQRPDALTKLTMTGAILGTPAYMAPEQGRGVRHLGPSVDVFALGSVLFECLVGTPAFNGHNANAVLAQILSGDIPRLARVKPDLPPALDALVARMMAYDPLERFRDAATAALAISDVLADEARPGWAASPVAARAALVSATVYVDADADDDMRACAERFGAHVTGAGRILATFELGTGAETARRAARCALEILERRSEARIAIVSARDATMPLRPEAFLDALPGVALEPGKIWVDAATVGHLGQSFELRAGDPGAWLVGHRRAPARLDAAPFVGRARELALIEGIFAEVSGEEHARAALVVGEPGIGKSHLVQVALRKLAATVFTAQADAPTSASPFEVIRGLLSRSDARFVRELAIDSAERDPLQIADQLRLAWLSFLEVELRAKPVVLVIEDLHLADAASVRLLGAALAEFAERALFVLATARLDEAPQLEPLAKHEPERIVLKPLRPNVAADLVRSHLGNADAELVERLVARAHGVPHRLASLARAAADDPAALDASAEAVLLRLEPNAQRAVRCASVFGMVFPLFGVADLLDAEDTGADVPAALALAADVVVPRPPRSYAFANALLHEAAYALLSDLDRKAAHGRAALWLSGEPGTDPSVVAWHFERAGDPDLAHPWYIQAARVALVAGAAPRARELAGKALACNPTGEDLARALLTEGEAAFAMADVSAGRAAGERVLAMCVPGSTRWLRAAAMLVSSAGQVGDNERVIAIASLVRDQAVGPKEVALRVVSLCRATTQLLNAGRRTIGAELLAEAERAETTDPDALAWLAHAQSVASLLADDYPRTIELMRRSAQLHIVAGNIRSSILLRIFVASARIFAGDFAGAEADLDVVEPLARRAGADFYVKWARYTRAKITALNGEARVAREELAEIVRELANQPRIVAGAHVHSALAGLRAFDAAWAEEEARAALAHREPASRAVALGVLSLALTMSGAKEEALEAAREGASIVAELGSLTENESVVHVALVDALTANGMVEEAKAAAVTAVARLERIAAKFGDGPERGAYLASPANARTLKVAHRLGV